MDLLPLIEAAGASGQLFPAAVAQLRTWLAADLPTWARQALVELVQAGAWTELNDRFYRDIEFGTGGMRSRTIGVTVTPSERGTPSPLGTPEHPAVGANLMNDFTVIRATVGLYRYTAAYLSAAGRADRPAIVIAHDVRHFSRHFCELAASTWARLGGTAYIFDGPRSTPQLSFSVRYLRAHTGVVITASHNPPHDNGFKAYFEDGAQVTPPHDKSIIAEVGQVKLDETVPFLAKQLTGVITLGATADAAYHAAAMTAVLDPALVKQAGLKVVFTNIHGVGGVASVPLLRAAGVTTLEVPEQREFDARFPSVKSPNPENAEALTLAIKLATAEGADAVLATDPDCDRMGVAVRNRAGSMELLTGNQIGSLLVAYRLAKFKELGWIPAEGSNRAVLVKTFVTTPLQDAIGAAHGVKVINTLTGFKWIGAKIARYEAELKAALLREQGIALDYDATPFVSRAKLLLQYSSFYTFGTEESYGYLPNDSARDKDGNAACLMFAELCAAVKARGLTVPEFLDELYLAHGFCLEAQINIYYEGASGAAKIKRILDTYRTATPTSFGDTTVTKFTDFGRETVIDADGETIPKQDLYFVNLANGYTFAARGSGTEPKMKFYLFAQEKVASAAQLAEVKALTKARLETLAKLIEADARTRAEG